MTACISYIGFTSYGLALAHLVLMNIGIAEQILNHYILSVAALLLLTILSTVEGGVSIVLNDFKKW